MIVVPRSHLPHDQAEGCAANLRLWQDRLDWCKGEHIYFCGPLWLCGSSLLPGPWGDLHGVQYDLYGALRIPQAVISFWASHLEGYRKCDKGFVEKSGRSARAMLYFSPLYSHLAAPTFGLRSIILIACPTTPHLLVTHTLAMTLIHTIIVT